MELQQRMNHWLLILLLIAVATPICAQPASSPPDDTAERKDGVRITGLVGIGTQANGDPTYSFDLRVWNVGIGIATVNTFELIPEYSDGEPHPDSSVALRHYDLGYIGGDVRAYINAYDGQLAFFAGVGYYAPRMLQLRHLASTGEYYRGDPVESPLSSKVAYSAGAVGDFIDIHAVGFAINAGIEFHSMRGFVAMLGFSGLL